MRFLGMVGHNKSPSAWPRSLADRSCFSNSLSFTLPCGGVTLILHKFDERTHEMYKSRIGICDVILERTSSRIVNVRALAAVSEDYG